MEGLISVALRINFIIAARDICKVVGTPRVLGLGHTECAGYFLSCRGSIIDVKVYYQPGAPATGRGPSLALRAGGAHFMRGLCIGRGQKGVEKKGPRNPVAKRGERTSWAFRGAGSPVLFHER